MRKVIFSLCVICLFSILQLHSQSVPKFITAVEGVKEYELNNGLRVLLIPDASQSNFVVNIVYKVGSRHEGYGESGMAHLLEHMLFKQSKKFGSIKKAIADKGAWANGTTWYDRTHYYEILSYSNENLRWAIELEADRMVNCKMLATELKTEFSVVRNEFEIGENDPGSVLQDRVVSSMYLWHNYGKSTIGSKEDIERVKAENLKVFYKKYYQPDNAVLIVAGKFDERKALAYVQQYFAPIPRPIRKLNPTYTVEPTQDGERRVTLRRTGDVQYLGLAYHTAPYSSPDFASNTALIHILTNNPSGILYKKLVETKIASGIYGYALSLQDPGYTYFQLEVPKDQIIENVERTLTGCMDRLNTITISEEDLTRAKNSLLKDINEEYSNTINFAIGLTECIGSGDWRLWFLNRDRIENLILQDIENVKNKYYKSSNRTIGVFIPDSLPDRTVVSDKGDIHTLLKGYRGKAEVLQKTYFENTIESIAKHTELGTLSNGGKFALLKKPTKGEKIEANLEIRFGNENNLANTSEISSITASLLNSGTTTKLKGEIKDELDRIKSDISFYSFSSGISISLSTDKNNLAKALSLLEDMLRNPKFDSLEFEKIKLENKVSLEISKGDPWEMANMKLNKWISPYPKGHPYYSDDTEESLDKLAKVKLEDVRKFYYEFYGANHSTAAFVGEIDKELIKDFLHRTFGDWQSKSEYAEIESKYFEVQDTTFTVYMPDKTNAIFRAAINIGLSQESKDYPALYMANELLGGGAFLSSRIPHRLREQEGMSYGASTYLNANYKYDAASWSAFAAFNPIYKNRIDTAFHEEIEKAILFGFTNDEFEKSRNSFLEGNKSALGTNNFLANLIQNYQFENKSIDEFSKFEAKIKSLSLDEVNAAMRKYFDKSKLVSVYCGDFEKKE